MPKRRTVAREFKARAVLEGLSGVKDAVQACQAYRLQPSVCQVRNCFDHRAATSGETWVVERQLAMVVDEADSSDACECV